MSELFQEEVVLETKTSFWNVFKWSMYDLANTVYSMVIVSLIINDYILIIGQKEYGMTFGQVELVYGAVILVVQLIIAIGMPIMGALSDTVGKRKPFVLVLTGVILLFASLLGLSHSLWLVLLLYVVSNMAYQWSLAFYDPMLVFIAHPKDAGKVGGIGVAIGYFGTIIGIAVMMVLQGFWGTANSVSGQTTIAGNVIVRPLEYGYYDKGLTFAIAMGIFLIFAIPFIFVKERQKKSKRPPVLKLVKQSFVQLGETFKDIRGHREMFKFIIGYFLIVEVANVVVLKMYLIVRYGMGMDPGFSQIFLIIATVSAVIFTYPVGMFADKKGAKATFILVCSLWAAALVIAVIASLLWYPIDVPSTFGGSGGWTFPFIMVLLMGLLAGPALGGTWVAQRYMVLELAPKEKFGEYFGFSKLSGKVSASLGPLIWGAIMGLEAVLLLNNVYAIAIAVAGAIMLVGLVIILFVRPQKHILKEEGVIAKV